MTSQKKLSTIVETGNQVGTIAQRMECGITVVQVFSLDYHPQGSSFVSTGSDAMVGRSVLLLAV